VEQCLRFLELSAAEEAPLWAVVGAVLHLGNLRFAPVEVESEAGAAVEPANGGRDCLAAVAALLGVPEAALERALTRRLVRAGGGKSQQVALAEKVLDPGKAADTANALAKALYERLFEWLVRRINATLQPRAATGTGMQQPRVASAVGVLDLFGFEIFENNSFEQLCINFANETLQRHFNFHIFTLESRLYEAEGVTCEQISFEDNEDVLQVLALGFERLDDEGRVPKGSSDGFFSKFMAECKGHPRIVHTQGRRFFAVRHYAGVVRYSPDSFLFKNKDELSQDLVDTARLSTEPFIAQLLDDKPATGG
jgi:myosin heavy subunit